MNMPNTRRIRQILAVAIVASSVALAAAVMIRQFRSTPPESARPLSPAIDMSLAKLDFSEMRGNNKLWDLAADRADYDKKAGAAILTGVKAQIYDSKAGGLVITSQTGWYHEQQHLIKMQDKVHVVTQKGMTFDTELLEYRTAPGLILTEQPVKVRDGRLTLTAKGMELSLNDEKVRFGGPVVAIIEGYHGKR
jgi:LPS export ABC transporter protein LptC